MLSLEEEGRNEDTELPESRVKQRRIKMITVWEIMGGGMDIRLFLTPYNLRFRAKLILHIFKN